MQSCSIPLKRCLLSVHNVLCSARCGSSYVPPKDRDTPKHCDMLTLASSERTKRLEIKIADVFKAKINKNQLNIIIVYREKKVDEYFKIHDACRSAENSALLSYVNYCVEGMKLCMSVQICSRSHNFFSQQQDTKHNAERFNTSLQRHIPQKLECAQLVSHVAAF